MTHFLRSIIAAGFGAALFVLVLVTVGMAQSPSQGTPQPRLPERTYLDYTFGGDGIATLPITGVAAYALQLDNGQILLWHRRILKPPYYEPIYALLRLNADGALDTRFGDNGVVKMTTDPAEAYVYGSRRNFVVQSDGKIIAFYDRQTLVRYTADGITDTNYGLNGMLTVPRSEGDFSGAIQGLQADDKLFFSYQDNYYNGSYRLYRFNADGTPDASFGISGTIASESALGLGSVAFLPDGSFALDNYNNARDDSGTQGFCRLDHYTRDGQPLGSLTGSDQYCFSGVQQADGKLIVGYRQAPYPIMRLNVDGSVDRTFGIDGLLYMDRFPNVFQPDGTMLVLTPTLVPTQTLRPNFAVLRYKPTGELDATFGESGQLIVPVAGVPPYNTASGAYDIALGLNDTFLVAGVHDTGYLEHVQLPFVIRIRNTPMDVYRIRLPITLRTL